MAELSGHAEEGTLATSYTNVLMLPLKLNHIEKLNFPVGFAELKYDGRFRRFLEYLLLKPNLPEEKAKAETKRKHDEAVIARKHRTLVARKQKPKE